MDNSKSDRCMYMLDTSRYSRPDRCTYMLDTMVCISRIPIAIRIISIGIQPIVISMAIETIMTMMIITI